MQPYTESITLLGRDSLYAEIDAESIAEEACNAAFKVIADRIDEAVGGRTSGDFDPGEVFALERVFQMFVRAMAVNNDKAGPDHYDDDEED